MNNQKNQKVEDDDNPLDKLIYISAAGQDAMRKLKEWEKNQIVQQILCPTTNFENCPKVSCFVSGTKMKGTPGPFCSCPIFHGEGSEFSVFPVNNPSKQQQANQRKAQNNPSSPHLLLNKKKTRDDCTHCSQFLFEHKDPDSYYFDYLHNVTYAHIKPTFETEPFILEKDEFIEQIKEDDFDPKMYERPEWRELKELMNPNPNPFKKIVLTSTGKDMRDINRKPNNSGRSLASTTCSTVNKAKSKIDLGTKEEASYSHQPLIERNKTKNLVKVKSKFTEKNCIIKIQKRDNPPLEGEVNQVFFNSINKIREEKELKNESESNNNGNNNNKEIGNNEIKAKESASVTDYFKKRSFNCSVNKSSYIESVFERLYVPKQQKKEKRLRKKKIFRIRRKFRVIVNRKKYLRSSASGENKNLTNENQEIQEKKPEVKNRPSHLPLSKSETSTLVNKAKKIPINNDHHHHHHQQQKQQQQFPDKKIAPITQDFPTNNMNMYANEDENKNEFKKRNTKTVTFDIPNEFPIANNSVNKEHTSYYNLFAGKNLAGVKEYGNIGNQGDTKANYSQMQMLQNNNSASNFSLTNIKHQMPMGRKNRYYDNTSKGDIQFLDFPMSQHMLNDTMKKEIKSVPITFLEDRKRIFTRTSATLSRIRIPH